MTKEELEETRVLFIGAWDVLGRRAPRMLSEIERLQAELADHQAKAAEVWSSLNARLNAALLRTDEQDVRAQKAEALAESLCKQLLDEERRRLTWMQDCQKMEVERNDWKKAHDDLVYVRQADLTVLAEKIERFHVALKSEAERVSKANCECGADDGGDDSSKTVICFAHEVLENLAKIASKRAAHVPVPGDGEPQTPNPYAACFPPKEAA